MLQLKQKFEGEEVRILFLGDESEREHNSEIEVRTLLLWCQGRAP